MQKIFPLLSKLGFILLLLVPAVVFQLAAQTQFVTSLIDFVQNYLIFYLIGLFILKSMSVIYPPLPGVVVTLASIPLIGWERAYIVDISGSAVGATVSFFLGRKYGYKLLRHLLGNNISDKISRLKLKQKNQIEAAIFLRFATGGLISDGLAWGASLIGFKYLPFIIGYLISHVVTTAPVFYLVAASISFNSWIGVAIAAVIAWFIIYKFKGRYFE